MQIDHYGKRPYGPVAAPDVPVGTNLPAAPVAAPVQPLATPVAPVKRATLPKTTRAVKVVKAVKSAD